MTSDFQKLKSTNWKAEYVAHNSPWSQGIVEFHKKEKVPARIQWV